MGRTSLGLLSSSPEDRMFIETVFIRRHSETDPVGGLVVYFLVAGSNPASSGLRDRKSFFIDV